jgi:mono/diheme cytochrome c family protein
VLRGAGAVATVDPDAAAVTARRDVCPLPRGIAWNPSAASLYVVCAGGEFVTLPAEGAAATARLAVDDLRDVVMHRGAPQVSTFRAASLHRVEPSGARAAVTATLRAPAPTDALAWRVAPVAGGGVITLSQSVRSRTLGAFGGSAGYYGDVTASVPMMPRVRFTLATGEAGLDARVPDGGLAVDVAAAFDGASLRVAIASPGWSFGQGVAPVREWILAHGDAWEVIGAERLPRTFHARGQPVAVTYTERRELVVQTRAPGRIVTPTRELVLYDDEVADEGHDIFHASTASGLACASCHPEGAEDGIAWDFLGTGTRRTPSLRGGILRTAPFHWDGDLRDMTALCDLVFTSRMGGDALRPAQAQRLGLWLDGLAAPRAPALDGEAVARGEALFRSAETGCATCHAGPMLTDNRSYDVGTGRRFQVPPLVGLAYRAPYMHDGCAATLDDRLTDPSCGGGDRHGRTSQLTPAQRADLVAFLASR